MKKSWLLGVLMLLAVLPVGAQQVLNIIRFSVIKPLS